MPAVAKMINYAPTTLVYTVDSTPRSLRVLDIGPVVADFTRFVLRVHHGPPSSLLAGLDSISVSGNCFRQQ